MPSIFLRRRGKNDRALATWDATFAVLTELARDGTSAELSADREAWISSAELIALAGIDLESSEAMQQSNITIVGNISARSIIATLAVLARDRSSGTLAAARTDPVTGEWYELSIREGRLARVMTNVAAMRLPPIIAEERGGTEDDIMPLVADTLKRRRPLEQSGWLQRLRLTEL